MQTTYMLGLAMLAGMAVGAATVKGLSAESKAPAYIVSEVEVTGDRETYMRDYASQVPATLQPYGGRFLVRGGKTIAVEGDPPKGRIVITVFDDIEKAKAWRESAEYKKIFPVRERLATSRQFIVEGVAQEAAPGQ